MKLYLFFATLFCTQATDMKWYDYYVTNCNESRHELQQQPFHQVEQI